MPYTRVFQQIILHPLLPKPSFFGISILFIYYFDSEQCSIISSFSSSCLKKFNSTINTKLSTWVLTQSSRGFTTFQKLFPVFAIFKLYIFSDFPDIIYCFGLFCTSDDNIMQCKTCHISTEKSQTLFFSPVF